MDVIEASETLLELKIMDWPKMKNSKRSEFHRSLMKTANPTGKARDIRDVIAEINGG